MRAECPAEAIFAEDDVPADQQGYIALNAELAKTWTPIVERKDPPADADEWRGVSDKLKFLGSAEIGSQGLGPQPWRCLSPVRRGHERGLRALIRESFSGIMQSNTILISMVLRVAAAVQRKEKCWLAKFWQSRAGFFQRSRLPSPLSEVVAIMTEQDVGPSSF